MFRWTVIAILAFTSPALAQQQADPAALQKVIIALKAQREEAMDKAALAEARAALLAEENQKLKAEAEKTKPKD